MSVTIWRSDGTQVTECLGRNNLTPEVSAMAHIAIRGDVVPPSWRKELCKTIAGGKHIPDRDAIDVLSYVVHWYTPALIIDDGTGDIVGYRKRFDTDIVQLSYQYIADHFSLSKTAIKTACDRLEQQGFIYREFRTVRDDEINRTSNNVMFIGINLDKIDAITYSITSADIEQEWIDKRFPDLNGGQ